MVLLNTVIADSWCDTQLKVVKYNYVWTINNFIFCRIPLRSSTFAAERDKEELKWSLELKYVDNSLQLELYLVSGKRDSVDATYEISILNFNGEESHTREDHKTFETVRNNHFGFPTFVTRDVLLDKRNMLLPDNKLTISCKIGIVVDAVNVSGNGNFVQLQDTDSTLSDDFSKLYLDPRFSDVTLSANGKNFQAHKGVLSVRSSVFYAMFEHDMEEKKKNRVEIPEVDDEAVREMLRYIYTGKVHHLREYAADLLPIADKYALTTLKVKCEEELSRNLLVENAAETLVLADLHTGSLLKAQAINFINKNTVRVMQTPGWDAMMKSHPALLVEAYTTLATRQPLPKVSIW